MVFLLEIAAKDDEKAASKSLLLAWVGYCLRGPKIDSR